MERSSQRAPWMTGISSLLSAAMGLPMLSFYGIGLLGPDLLVDLNLSVSELGSMSAVVFGPAALLSPWAGRLTRRLGTRATLVTLFILVGLSLSLLAVLPGVAGVVVALACGGIALAFGNPVSYQSIAEEVPPVRARFVVACKQSGIPLMAMLAGLTLPALAFEWGWRTALATWAPVALLLAIQVMTWLPTRQASTSWGIGQRMKLPNRFLWLLMGIQFCAAVGLASFVVYFGVYADRLDIAVQRVGMMLAVFGAVGLLSRLAFSKASDRIEDESLVLGMLLSQAGLALALMRLDDGQQYWLWLGMVGMGLTVGATHAIAMNMLIRDRCFGGASAARGMLAAAYFAGFAIGPAAFGWYLGAEPDARQFDSAWLLLIAVLLCGCLMAIRLLHLRRKATQSDPATSAQTPAP
ncbi:MAG: MFS transporter [Lautropia sp.]|nr:MFS transporter [Lautropia sp.]